MAIGDEPLSECLELREHASGEKEGLVGELHFDLGVTVELEVGIAGIPSHSIRDQDLIWLRSRTKAFHLYFEISSKEAITSC
jgi:hypothetical protein